MIMGVVCILQVGKREIEVIDCTNLFRGKNIDKIIIVCGNISAIGIFVIVYWCVCLSYIEPGQTSFLGNGVAFGENINIDMNRIFYVGFLGVLLALARLIFISNRFSKVLNRLWSENYSFTLSWKFSERWELHYCLSFILMGVMVLPCLIKPDGWIHGLGGKFFFMATLSCFCYLLGQLTVITKIRNDAIRQLDSELSKGIGLTEAIDRVNEKMEFKCFINCAVGEKNG